MSDRPPRVLIVTADIGAGHDLPARLLADAIRAAPEPLSELRASTAAMLPTGVAFSEVWRLRRALATAVARRCLGSRSDREFAGAFQFSINHIPSDARGVRRLARSLHHTTRAGSNRAIRASRDTSGAPACRAAA